MYNLCIPVSVGIKRCKCGSDCSDNTGDNARHSMQIMHAASVVNGQFLVNDRLNKKSLN